MKVDLSQYTKNLNDNFNDVCICTQVHKNE